MFKESESTQQLHKNKVAEATVHTPRTEWPGQCGAAWDVLGLRLSLGLTLDDEGLVVLVLPLGHLEQLLGRRRLSPDQGRTLICRPPGHTGSHGVTPVTPVTQGVLPV